jgi:hypothetical protein
MLQLATEISFHLEVRRGLARARLFNLGPAELDGLLIPWSRGETVEIGEREWDPADTKLTVLEGPRLDPADLAMGQGWNNASKLSRDVSGERLARAHASRRVGGAIVVVAQGDEERRAVESVLEQLGLSAAEWGAVRASLLEQGTQRPDGTATVVTLDDPVAVTFFEALAERLRQIPG